MSPVRHALRVGLLMAAAAIYLGALAARTEVFYADGLRYIKQAQALDRGSWRQAIVRAEDHPVYPLAIALAHRVHGGDAPADWQAAGQAASVVAGTLLIVPLYLFALELHGAAAAWLTCVLAFLVPLTGHVLADVLSEGTFLLFWMTGCWCALRFLRNGSTAWLLGAICLGGIAYLVRPEGLLLPVALAGFLAATLAIRPLRLEGAAGRRAWLILIVGPLLIMGPYVVLRGGLGTKPAVGRLLGLRPPSAAMAVERERPLDPGQSALRTFGLACRGAGLAVLGAVPPPLFLLAASAAPSLLRDRGRRRGQVFMGLVCVAWLLALVRLHMTSGYSTPRHALILALPLLAAAARGLNGVADGISARLSEMRFLRAAVRPAVLGLVLLVAALGGGRELGTPPNEGFRGYRLAGEWIAAHTPEDARVLDLKGWGLFYGRRWGYSFAELESAQQDKDLGWVVAHDSLLVGPWAYCDVVRKAVRGRRPVRSFPATRQRGVAQVHVFDLRPELSRGGHEKGPR